MVEHRRFELLTPTLPVLCATNCANAPSAKSIIAQIARFVKRQIEIFLFSGMKGPAGKDWSGGRKCILAVYIDKMSARKYNKDKISCMEKGKTV